MKHFKTFIQNQTFYLLPEKVIFWEEQKALILSDLHIGKASHFRKAGVPISSYIHIKEFFVLDAIIEDLKPSQILFVGDLFHSEHNQEWELFYNWAHHYANIELILIKGNHDILPKTLYQNSRLKVVDQLLIDHIEFTHERKVKSDSYNISGHIHPAVSLIGSGKQSLKLPCFLFREDHAFLPAFGHFTGMSKIKPSKKDNIFVVAENEIIHVS
ncbi:putative phosphoesterase [Reichenbachiella faecimaris]|uniref:Putative phosphoesterase n=1 Tax=Reichenbachiella faecimaris TaxID=692418 RepID=A0A1W2GGW0_REIFA|nr:ligase-associated DNA damage response endonuclease PdeM [Reichenbachiella faecimaris]SMD35903.1 putative phosphoesterase [Reichenbachiella faecimaris]